LRALGLWRSSADPDRTSCVGMVACVRSVYVRSCSELLVSCAQGLSTVDVIRRSRMAITVVVVVGRSSVGQF